MTTAEPNTKRIASFFEYAKDKTLVAGYGSLLSRDSRQRYNQINSPALPLMVHNWQRSWITRSEPERQTYVGARKVSGAKLNACLLALDLDPAFIEREQDYRFVELGSTDIEYEDFKASELNLIQSFCPAIYICESLLVQASNSDYPVNYSYINTCLMGAKELRGTKGVEDFLNLTTGWNEGSFRDDMKNIHYPRAARPLEPLFNL